MKKLVLASLLMLVTGIASAGTTKISNDDSSTETVQIRKVMEIKECLTSKSVSYCLNGRDVHVIQRILSHYVLAQSRRSIDR